jgi:hypothetical protein
MAGYQWLKDIRDNFIKDIVRALKPIGKRALLEAYRTGHTDAPRPKTEHFKAGPQGQFGEKWRHKLGNLHDSYVSGVFVDGVLVRSSVQYLDNPISKAVDERTEKKGRQTALEYLQRMSFGKKRGEVVLVVAAAMFYTRWLERTGRFIVITPAKDYINKHVPPAIATVYAKYGLKAPVRTKVIKGEYIKGLSDYKKQEENG